MDDNVVKPASYGRERLYEEVWAEPVRTVAERYGVSDVALAKACRRMKVPLPGRGYWAKKKAGRAPDRPALPELSLEDEANLKWTSEYRAQQRAQQRGRPMRAPVQNGQPKVDVKVEERLVRPHALVAQARQLLRQPGRRIRFPTLPEEPCLDVDVSRGTLPRALRIMDALIKALESQGYEVENTAPERKMSYYDQSQLVYGVTRVRVRGHWVNFGLSENSTQVEVHVPLDWAKEWGGYSIQRVREGTGKLSLFISNSPHGLRRTWNDGKKQRVEDCLGSFISYLPVIAQRMEEERIEAERRHQLWLEEERLKEEARERRREEARRIGELDEDLTRWRLAWDIRAFVAEVRERYGEKEQPEELRDRLEWSLGYADSLDPIRELLATSSNGIGKD